MKNFETPFDFELNKTFEDVTINYYDVIEFAQGSPEIGKILINGIPIEQNYFFGGPLLFNDKAIYLPVFMKSFIRTGFKLAKVNRRDFDVEFIGKIKNLIYLYKIEDNIIYYYTNMTKTKSDFVKI